jgi:hypothetical protein
VSAFASSVYKRKLKRSGFCRVPQRRQINPTEGPQAATAQDFHSSIPPLAGSPPTVAAPSMTRPVRRPAEPRVVGFKPQILTGCTKDTARRIVLKADSFALQMPQDNLKVHDLRGP